MTMTMTDQDKCHPTSCIENWFSVISYSYIHVISSQVDPSFQNTLAKFDDGGTAGLMLNQLRCLDDTCELVLDCNTVVTSAGNSSACKTRPQLVDITELGG